MATTTVLLVDWKQEPLSPIFADELTLAPLDDAPLYWTNVEQSDPDQLKHEEVVIVDAPSPSNETVDDAGFGADLLDNLKFEEIKDLSEWIKTESSSFPWFEDQNFDYAEVNGQTGTTHVLLEEFQTVLDAVNTGALTPPQSPPYEQPTTLITLEPLSSNLYVKEQPPQYQEIPYSIPSTPVAIAHELAVVDELVRARTQEILSEPLSPSTSNSIDDSSSCSEDPEWIPETVEEFNEGKAKRRYKPYHRVNPEDKKSRKKEQNKNAATRYRMKKKAEVEVILSEERQVQESNEKLTEQIGDLQREIRYLKGLMRDLFKAKGLIH